MNTIDEPLEATLERLNKIRSLSPAEEDSATRKTESRRVEEILAAANLPKRQFKKTNLDRSGKWGEVATKIADKLGTGFTIGIAGIRGNGKTQLAIEIAKVNAQKLRSCLYCTATEFLMAIKSTYKAESEQSEASIIAAFTLPKLLIIDELGKRSENDWENRLIFELLNRRYNSEKDSLIISNQDVSQMEASLGPSLVSRMLEGGGVFECTWESYRK